MNQQVIQRVISCISATTRYPRNLLHIDADMETDLGIDSVKRVEITIALGDEFGFSAEAEERDPNIRTIGDIVGWVEGLLERRSGVPDPAPGIEPPLHATGNGFTNAHEADVKLLRRIDAGQPVALDQDAKQRTLSGKIALVTGSGRGVGKVVAMELAARGAKVFVNSFHSRESGENTVNAIRAAGGEAEHLWGSVTNPDHVGQLFADIEQRFGGLDFLICNASDGRIGDFLELTMDDWDRAFRTNVAGHHQCAVQAARLMRPRGGGAIVTMSAVGAHRYVEGLGSQGVVKAAVESLTRYLACELGGLGIRVNCVSAGPVYGELIDKFPEADQAKRRWEAVAPNGRLTSPAEIASTIAFLVSDGARGINGAVWSVDHGFSASVPGQRLRTVQQPELLSSAVPVIS